jgi:hypothetical protein
MTPFAIPKAIRKLFNKIFDDEDDTPFCLMARNTKTQESSTSSLQPSSTFDNVQNDLEEQHRAYMIKEFGKKDFKETKKLMETYIHDTSILCGVWIAGESLQ